VVQVKIVEDLSQECRVTARQLKHTASDLMEQVRYSLLNRLGVFLLWHLPSRFHHSHEVLIRRSAHWNVCVVVAKFVKCYGAIFLSTGALEIVKENGQDLLFGCSSLNEVRMHGDIVDFDNVAYCDGTASILVQHRKGFQNHVFTARRQLISKIIIKFNLWFLQLTLIQ